MNIQQISVEDAQAFYEIGVCIYQREEAYPKWKKWRGAASPQTDHDWATANGQPLYDWGIEIDADATE